MGKLNGIHQQMANNQIDSKSNGSQNERENQSRIGISLCHVKLIWLRNISYAQYRIWLSYV